MKNLKKFQSLSPRVSGIFLAIGATVIWSGNYIIARGLHDSISPLTLSFLRWLVAFSIIFPFSFRMFLNDLPVIKRNFKFILTVSFLGITLFNSLIYIAGHSTEAINLSLIAITTPVFIIVFSRIFFKEKISLLNFSGVLLTLTGIIILICRGSITILLNISFSAGDFWMLGAAITFALYSLLLRNKPDGIGMLSFLFVTFGAGLIMLLPFFLYEITGTRANLFSFNVTISILYIGIFASIGGYFMWNRAVELIGASNSGIIYYSLPVFSTLWAILILGEQIQLVHFISMGLIVGGIIIATRKNS